jgi:hypothetical protein
MRFDCQQWKSFYSEVGVCRHKHGLEPVATISCGAFALLYLSGSYQGDGPSCENFSKALIPVSANQEPTNERQLGMIFVTASVPQLVC